MIEEAAFDTGERPVPEDEFEDIAGEGLIFETAGGVFIVDTYLRDPFIYIDIKASFDPAIDGEVTGYSISLIDGSPLPDWVREIRPGFLCADPPAYTGATGLLMKVATKDQEDHRFSLKIDCRTGGISKIDDAAAQAA